MAEQARVHLKIEISKEDESTLIIDLLTSSGWKVEYQCEEKDNPRFIITSLVRS